MLYFVFFLLYLVSCTESFLITIDAHAEECFFEKITVGTKLGLTFEVAEGGFLDIDFKIVGPDGNTLHEAERESNGRYTFPAMVDGLHTYCFSNKMSTVTPKVVLFSVDIIDAQAKHDISSNAEGEEGGGKKLEDMITELSASLTGVKHEQDYMEVREKVHRSINENTNSRVVMWSFFEALVLVGMTGCQVYYLKQFFEVRRVV